MRQSEQTRRHFLGHAMAALAGLLGITTAWPLAVAWGKNRRRLPIEHVIIIHRENHSYDNYFGTFPGGNGRTTGYRCKDIQPDPPHDRAAALRGVSTARSGECHYIEEDIPNYFAYAREYTLCDNYFADIRGPSDPNYFMMMAAQTPVLGNVPLDRAGKYDLMTIADKLTEKRISWTNYHGGIQLVKMFKKANASGKIVPLAQFTSDALSGKLPSVSWVTPHMDDSEHPPASVKRGENWTVTKVNAVMKGPLWTKSAIIIMYDEWGGFWDHVNPPVVEKEPGMAGYVTRYGYRVPCLIISPYAKRGHVSHTLYSHVSVLRTLEAIYDLSPLNERDADAHNLLGCFDFNQKPRRPLIVAERP